MQICAACDIIVVWRDAQEGLSGDSNRFSRALDCSQCHDLRGDCVRRQCADATIPPILNATRGSSGDGDSSVEPDAGRDSGFADADFPHDDQRDHADFVGDGGPGTRRNRRRSHLAKSVRCVYRGESVHSRRRRSKKAVRQRRHARFPDDERGRTRPTPRSGHARHF